MFLGVHYVSEICTVDGTRFAPGILEGDASQLSYQTTLTKPYPERLGDRSWRLWKKILKILTPSPKTTTNKLMRKRLGKWIDTHSACGKGLLYQDGNGKFHVSESHKVKE